MEALVHPGYLELQRAFEKTVRNGEVEL